MGAGRAREHQRGLAGPLRCVASCGGALVGLLRSGVVAGWGDISEEVPSEEAAASESESRSGVRWRLDAEGSIDVAAFSIYFGVEML